MSTLLDETEFGTWQSKASSLSVSLQARSGRRHKLGAVCN